MPFIFHCFIFLTYPIWLRNGLPKKVLHTYSLTMSQMDIRKFYNVRYIFHNHHHFNLKSLVIIAIVFIRIKIWSKLKYVHECSRIVFILLLMHEHDKTWNKTHLCFCGRVRQQKLKKTELFFVCIPHSKLNSAHRALLSYMKLK